MVIDNQKTEDEEEDRLNFNEKSTAVGTAQTLIINERYLSEVEKAGYPRTFLVRSLNNDELNYATSFYYLLNTQKEFWELLTHNSHMTLINYLSLILKLFSLVPQSLLLPLLCSLPVIGLFHS